MALGWRLNRSVLQPAIYYIWSAYCPVHLFFSCLRSNSLFSSYWPVNNVKGMTSSVKQARETSLEKTGMVMSLWHGNGDLHAAHYYSGATRLVQPHTHIWLRMLCGTTLAHHHVCFDTLWHERVCIAVRKCRLKHIASLLSGNCSAVR